MSMSSTTIPPDGVSLEGPQVGALKRTIIKVLAVAVLAVSLGGISAAPAHATPYACQGNSLGWHQKNQTVVAQDWVSAYHQARADFAVSATVSNHYGADCIAYTTVALNYGV